MSWLNAPRGLPAATIKNINRDLITYVLNSATGTISGEGLDYIYRELHGITSHGFEPDSLYKIFFRDKNYALVLKTGELKDVA